MLKKYASAKILFEEAEKRGLKPVWETQRGLFSVKSAGKRRYLYYTKLHINSQLGAWICQDKSLARKILEKEGFPNIPYCCSNQVRDVNVFFDTHKTIIQKPQLGERSEDVRLIRKREDIDMSTIEDSIFEKYIEGTEYRCLILNGKTIGMQKKKLRPTDGHPWSKHITNLSPGEWHTELTVVAEDIAKILHMGFIAVDFIIDASGTAWVLELNGTPGLHSFHHPDAGDSVNIAERLFGVILGES